MATSLCRVLLLLLLNGASLSSANTIRGIPLEKASLYVPGKGDLFSCLDGSEKIPFSYVNDDYCDCSDGSDEPGTPACPDTVFYCPNRGHRPTYLLSSRVNDNVCDCCDGSDEWDTGSQCPNNCEEMGRAAAAELQKQREAHAQGYEKMLQYSKTGQEKKEQYQLELTQFENDLGVVESEIETLRQAKEDAEEPETKAKDEHKTKWEEVVSARKAAKRAEEAKKMFEKLDADSDGRVTVREVMNHPELDDDGDGLVSLDEANRYMDESESVDFDGFLERVWDAISVNIAKREEEKAEQDATVSEKDGEKEEKDEDDDDDDDDSDEDSDRDLAEQGTSEEMPAYDAATQELIAAADKARAELQEAESRKRDLENRRNERQQYLNMELGEMEQFAPLHHQCFEFTDREYIYKLCMFQKVTQRNKNGGSETSLGNWEKWEGSGSGSQYSVMRYGNGEKCWNGPNRSTVVTLRCGLQEEILSAGEPNRCEYAMEFSTPAFCLEKLPPHLHTEL